jgi:CO/xanthine dehydrogenase Mo-binding subunit
VNRKVDPSCCRLNCYGDQGGHIKELTMDPNFDTYHPLSMSEAPEVEPRVIGSTEPAGEISELNAPAIEPAGVHMAIGTIGKRIRKLLIDSLRG